MPKIKPFRGVHFDPARTYGLSPVIGPPEDLPNLDEASRIVQGRPYHSLRLELGGPETSNWGSSDLVRKQVFERWVEDGVLIRSDEPAFFVHEHRYRREGLYYRRLGLFAAAEISDDPGSGFLPHERIMSGNLQYRTELLRNLRLSISPIFTIIRDGGLLGAVLADLVQARPPDLSGHDAEEGVHRVWTLRDPYLIAWFKEFAGERPLYIADGHHRFAAARAVRDERISRGDDSDAASSVLTLIVSEFDPGVSILPIHREVQMIPNDMDVAERRLSELFDIQCLLKPDQVSGEFVNREVQKFSGSGDRTPEFLMLRTEDRCLSRVRLRDWKTIDELLDQQTAEHVRGLDATVGHRVILEHVLGIERGDESRNVSYTADAVGLAERVINGESAFGLFMRSPRLEQVLAVADAGAHMPQKSTYFYPKVPAGLVMYDLG